MKKRLFFLLAFIFSLMPILGQETSKHFTFPITPKDSKWSEYKTTAERIRVLQIPKELLTSIPTEELLDILSNLIGRNAKRGIYSPNHCQWEYIFKKVCKELI